MAKQCTEEEKCIEDQSTTAIFVQIPRHYSQEEWEIPYRTAHTTLPPCRRIVCHLVPVFRNPRCGGNGKEAGKRILTTAAAEGVRTDSWTAAQRIATFREHSVLSTDSRSLFVIFIVFKALSRRRIRYSFPANFSRGFLMVKYDNDASRVIELTSTTDTIYCA